MSRILTSREKSMLGGCIAVIVLSASSLVGKEFLSRRNAVEQKITALTSEKNENEAWLSSREIQDKRKVWLDAAMPTTNSLGRAQGQLLEELQNAVLDRGMKIVRTTLNDPTKNANYQEVTVNINLRSDQAVAIEWLSTLQSPETFQIIKAIEINPDDKAKEVTPQAFVNLTIARWFKPEGI